MARPCCFSGFEHPGTPLGRVETIHDLPTYISEPEGTPKALLVIIPDAFGWDFKNLRILADIYCNRTGARIYLPDFMNGHAADPQVFYTIDKVLNPAPTWMGVLTTKIPAILYVFSQMAPFLYHNRLSVCEPRVRKWFTQLRANEGASTKIGAAGFCWGGKYVTLLSHGEATAPSGLPLLDAGFTAHPSGLVVPGDIEKVERPLSIAIGDKDMAMKLALVNKAKEVLMAKAPEKHEVVILPDAKHGFAVRGHPDDPKEREQAQTAEDQAVEFFKKWLEIK